MVDLRYWNSGWAYSSDNEMGGQHTMSNLPENDLPDGTILQYTEAKSSHGVTLSIEQFIEWGVLVPTNTMTWVARYKLRREWYKKQQRRKAKYCAACGYRQGHHDSSSWRAICRSWCVVQLPPGEWVPNDFVKGTRIIVGDNKVACTVTDVGDKHYEGLVLTVEWDSPDFKHSDKRVWPNLQWVGLIGEDSTP